MYKPVKTHPNFPELEEEVLKFWEDNKIFQKSLEQNYSKEPFVFYEGPPTANAAPGIHHVEARAFKDVIPRFQTMRGKYVRRKAGWDTHGLPVELQIEKKLGISGKKQIESLKDSAYDSIAYFNKLCRDSVWEFKGEWEKLTRRMGFWIDLDHPYITYENAYIEKVWGVIKHIWDQGLIYQGHKVLPYCPRCGTALSSHEVAQGYKVVKDTSIYAKFKVSTTGSLPKNFQDYLSTRPDKKSQVYILAWTTTPWTLPGNVALAVGADIDYVVARIDEDYYIVAKDRMASVFESKNKSDMIINPENVEVVSAMKGRDLVGLEYEALFDIQKLKSNKSYRVYPAKFVTTNDGTGVVHTAVMYGEDDYQLGEEVQLTKYHTVDEEGKFVQDLADVGLAGLAVKDEQTTSKIFEHLRKRNLIFGTEVYEHEYPHCWRCSTPLLYYARNSWFIRMSEVKDQLQKNNQTVNWIPEYIKDGRFGQWLTDIKDWAISRERYWGTPLPFWQCSQCKKYRVIGSIAELQKATGMTDPAHISKLVIDLHRPYVDDIILKCESCGGKSVRIPEVADVWFDSGSMPFAQDLKNDSMQFPADYIAEAIDQTRGWFYTLLAISTLLQQGAPYKNVVCLGHMLDSKGQKMSKSKGNVVNPWDVGNKYGFDAIRWYFYSVNQPGDSKFFNETDLASIQRRVQLILWNVYNYFVTYANDAEWNMKVEFDNTRSENILDHWLVARTQDVVNETTINYEKFDIFHSTRMIEAYITDLSTWYVRRSRGRRDNDFFVTLYRALLTLSRLIAPTMPFLAEAIYRNLISSEQVLAKGSNRESESVHLSTWPESRELSEIEKKVLQEMQSIRSLVEAVHGIRAKVGIKLRQPLQSLTIPSSDVLNSKTDVRLFDILKTEINVKDIVFGEKLELDIIINEQLKIEGLARDLERQIQVFRKESGLSIGKMVDLEYSTASDMIEKVLKHLDRNKIYVSLINAGSATGGKDCLVGNEMVRINILNT